MDFDQIGAPIRSQTKVYRPIAGRGVADARGHMVVLGTNGLADHLDSCTNAVPIALRAAQGDVEPVVGGLAAIHPDFCGSVECRHNDVDPAVSIQVGESTAAMARFPSG